MGEADRNKRHTICTRCVKCHAPVVEMECEPLEDHERNFGSSFLHYKPGSIHHTCSNGHRIEVKHVESETRDQFMRRKLRAANG